MGSMSVVNGSLPTEKRQTMSLVKNMYIAAIVKLPDDSNDDQIMEELMFLLMVRRGMNDFTRERTITNEEMEWSMNQWKRN